MNVFYKVDETRPKKGFGCLSFFIKIYYILERMQCSMSTNTQVHRPLFAHLDQHVVVLLIIRKEFKSLNS